MTMTAPSTVRWTAPAPCCGRDCEWQATGSDRVGALPVYRIDCDCEPVPVEVAS